MSKPEKISAAPTKSFFVEMFTKDIPLEQAVLDLVDNCIDGAKRNENDGDLPYDGKNVQIVFGEEEFRIVDNCGGFSTEIARDYAFRFGRPDKKKAISHSIGQFGVGMKRALFKFGDHFAVHSATTDETWAVDVEVDNWKKDDGDWTFEWKAFTPDADISNQRPGTEIWVKDLHPQVSRTFKTNMFEQQIKNLVKSRHRKLESMARAKSCH